MRSTWSRQVEARELSKRVCCADERCAQGTAPERSGTAWSVRLLHALFVVKGEAITNASQEEIYEISAPQRDRGRTA